MVFQDSDTSLSVYQLKNNEKITQYKLSANLKYSCEIPNREMIVLVTDDGKLQILDL